jgi:hypothetical protein
MATPTNLPAAFTVGQVLTSTQQNDLRGAFRVLQVVTDSTTTQISTTSATYATSNLTKSITPQSSSSKILVMTQQAFLASAAAAQIGIRLVRGASTVVWTNDAAMYFATDTGSTANILYLDSPATTSSTAYTVEFARKGGTGTAFAQLGFSTSNIVLMEISA